MTYKIGAKSDSVKDSMSADKLFEFTFERASIDV